MRELTDNGAHLDDLAKAWENAEAQRPPTPTTKPFDYSKVETAVTLYAHDKAQVNTNKVIKAVHEMVRDCSDGDQYMVIRYITARLRTLGFQPSRSGHTFSRREHIAPPAEEGEVTCPPSS